MRLGILGLAISSRKTDANTRFEWWPLERCKSLLSVDFYTISQGISLFCSFSFHSESSISDTDEVFRSFITINVPVWQCEAKMSLVWLTSGLFIVFTASLSKQLVNLRWRSIKPYFILPGIPVVNQAPLKTHQMNLWGDGMITNCLATFLCANMSQKKSRTLTVERWNAV